MSNLALDLDLEFDAASAPAPVLLKGDKWDTWAADIQNDGSMTYEGDDQPVSLAELITSAVEGYYQAIVDGRTLQLNYSGGKLFGNDPAPGAAGTGAGQTAGDHPV